MVRTRLVRVDCAGDVEIRILRRRPGLSTGCLGEISAECRPCLTTRRPADPSQTEEHADQMATSATIEAFKTSQPHRRPTVGRLVRRTHQQVAPAQHAPLRSRPRRCIRTWIAEWNDNAGPFVWNKSADEILDTPRHILRTN